MSMLICIVLEIFTSLYWLINVVWPLVGCCTFELRIYENENSLYVCHTAWKWKKSVHMYICIKCKQHVLDLFVKHTPKCYISDGLILLKVGFFRISKLVTSLYWSLAFAYFVSELGIWLFWKHFHWNAQSGVWMGASSGSLAVFAVKYQSQVHCTTTLELKIYLHLRIKQLVFHSRST